MAADAKAKQSAIKTGQTLFYFQAVDHTATELRSISDEQQKTLFRAFLAHPNLSDTKRLPGYCMLHLTQRVRLTTTLAAPWATQDTTGTVVGIEFDDQDSAVNAWRNSVSQPGEVKADMLPSQVYVKLDDCDYFFCPSFRVMPTVLLALTESANIVRRATSKSEEFTQ